MKIVNLIFVSSIILFSACGGQETNKATEAFRLEDIMKLLMPLTFRILSSRNISRDCGRSLIGVIKGISERKSWAIEMVDAMGKLPSGIKEGSLSFLGSYDECLNIVADENVTEPFQGKFCTLNFAPVPKDKATVADTGGMDLLSSVGTLGGRKIPEHLKFQWSACFPSTCNNSDILNAAQVTIGHILDSLGLPIHVTVQSCEVKNKIQLDTTQLVAMTILYLLALLLLSGTILDISLIFLKKLKPEYKEVKKGKAFRGVLAFSMYTNAEKILNTKSSSETLGAINGLRFLSMTWVILGHTYAFFKQDLSGNLREVLERSMALTFQLILNGTLSVDVFLFISGLLLTYVVMNEMKRRGNLNWALFYFHRIWRLTPPLAFVILLIFLMPLFGSGPFWKTQWEVMTLPCKTHWWAALLYVNNFVNSNGLVSMCVNHGWYLAIDMQYYVISPFILYALWRWPIGGLIINTLFLIATAVVPAMLLMENDYVPSIFPLTDPIATRLYLQNMYIKPYCRMGPYCIGIYVGYLLATKKRFNIHPIIQVLCWCLAIGSTTAVVFGTHEWNNGNPSPKEVNALFVATNRTAFALGIAWMIFACCTGYGGIINRILSWKAFIPLGRMTYMAYLIHPYVMYSLNWSLRERMIISHYYMIVTNFGFLVISYLLAFLASIAFETPFMNLEKVFLKTSTLKQPEVKPEENLELQNLDAPRNKEGHVNSAFDAENGNITRY